MSIQIQQEYNNAAINKSNEVWAKLEPLFKAKEQAVQNLHNANLDFEKNYYGEKSQSAIENLRLAVKYYESVEYVLQKVLRQEE